MKRIFFIGMALLLGTIALYAHSAGDASHQHASKTSSTIKYRFKVVQHAFKQVSSIGESVNVTEELMAASIQALNEAFAVANIEFIACEAHYIEVSKFPTEFKTNSSRGGDELKYCKPYDVSDAINIYYFPKIIMQNDDGTEDRIAGRSDNATLGWKGNRIIIDPAGADKSSMVHEMGHFFELLHTFDHSFGFESVDGVNCKNAGDLVCDTPAEPPPSFAGKSANVSFQKGKCIYVGQKKDGWGNAYSPLVNNYMTYVDSDMSMACRESFTQGQIDRILFQGLHQRVNLMIPQSITFNATIYANTFTPPGTGATVKINTLAATNILSTSTITGNSNVTFLGEEIRLGEGFRVTKGSLFSASYAITCDIPGGANASYIYGLLRKEEASASEEWSGETEQEEELEVVPNPTAGDTKIVFLSQHTAALNISVYNAIGNKVYTLPEQQVKKGVNEFEIDIFGLSNGLYYAIIESNDKRRTVRFVVQR